MVTSSEEDGTDNWKPTQDESEDDSEEEEEQVRQRVPKVAKKKRADCPVLRRQVRVVISFNPPMHKRIFKSKMSKIYLYLF